MKPTIALSAMALVAALAVTSIAQDEPEIPADTEVKTTESGLRYSVLEAGKEDRHPKFGDTVKVNYTGWLAKDGKKFDSSLDRGRPAEFKLGQVIEGWNEGLELMSPGARFKFHIPARLGYGARGTGPIPPNSDLIFVVELLDFTPGAEVPEFPKIDREKALTTDSGLVYQIIEAGKGPAAGKEDPIALDYVFWNDKGQIIGSSVIAGKPLAINPAKPTLDLFKELSGLALREGSVIVCEVPPALLFKDMDRGARCPPNTTTIWRVELAQVLVVPDFSMPKGGDLTKTASGLQYQVVKEGTGKQPKASDRVRVHYAGWLTDGKLFDSSYGRGEPAEFPLGGVIKGWTEGLQLMKEGAVYMFVIPANLGYGDRGSPPNIPGGATLVFQVELLKVL